MTDEELDHAVVAEARRVADNPNDAEEVAMLVLDLKRRGWTPAPPVDRWTLEARGLLAARWSRDANEIRRGDWDRNADFALTLKALQRGYEIGKAEADPLGVKLREVVEVWFAPWGAAKGARLEAPFGDHAITTTDLVNKLQAIIKEGGAG